MSTIVVGSGLKITGLNLYEKRDAFFADADAYAKAAPAAAAEMGQRLGNASRQKKTISLAELGRGLVGVLPSDKRAVVVDPSDDHLSDEQQDVLDQIAVHLASVAWEHCKELSSWKKPEILCNALIVGRGNQPTPGFWKFAQFTGRFPAAAANGAHRDEFWTREVKRVHEWFGQLQKDFPFGAGASS